MAVVSEIVESEGFNINPRKTRIMPRAQRQLVLGMVVNDGLNLARPSFDALKATLYNCSKAEWRTQNHAALGDYRAHLDGRIAWAESVNADRGRKLREAFSAIDWA